MKCVTAIQFTHISSPLTDCFLCRLFHQVTTCAGRRHRAEPGVQEKRYRGQRGKGKVDRMTARTAEAPGLSVPPPPPQQQPPHRCHGEPRASNGTCAEQLRLLPPFSSALALLVLVAVLVGIVLVSLATFHVHKRKLRNRKIRRAQEEYERDRDRDRRRGSPARAGASGSGSASGGGGEQPARPCVIVRPARREERPPRRSAESRAADVEAEDRQAPPPPPPPPQPQPHTAPLDC